VGGVFGVGAARQGGARWVGIRSGSGGLLSGRTRPGPRPITAGILWAGRCARARVEHRAGPFAALGWKLCHAMGIVISGKSALSGMVVPDVLVTLMKKGRVRLLALRYHSSK
jgi:hypothetical protein